MAMIARTIAVLFVMWLVNTPFPAKAVDFDQKIKALDGSQLTDQDGKPTDKFSLGFVAATSLVNSYPDEGNIAGEEKAKRYLLAVKVQKGIVNDLSAEDIALIKKMIAKNFAPLISGQAWLMLDPPKK